MQVDPVTVRISDRKRAAGHSLPKAELAHLRRQRGWDLHAFVGGFHKRGRNSPIGLSAGGFQLGRESRSHEPGSVELGYGSGAFTTAGALNMPQGFTPSGVAVGDFNGDGKLDFVIVDARNVTMSVLLRQ